MRRGALRLYAVVPWAALALAGCSERVEERRADASRSAPGPLEPVPAAPGAADIAATGSPGTVIAATAPVAAPLAASTARPYRDDIPLAPMGTPPHKSILEGRSDPNRVADAERDAVERGRRIVEARPEARLTGTFASPEELARAILDRTFFDDPALLDEIRITRAEFADLFWPEFPQSRPATSMKAGDAWGFHDAACRDGVTEILSAWGGKELHFVSIRFEVGFAPYTNFNLYKGAIIDAVDDRGDPVEIRAATVFVECHGGWKVYMYDA